MNLMKRILTVRSLEMLLSFLGCSLFLWAWISYVQPFPDRDSVHQFLFPVLNYLKASTAIGNDFFYLKGMMPDEFPSGILLIPWLISAFGLQELFLQTPWLLVFFLLAPFCIAVWLVPIPRPRKWIFLFLLFFFPPIQLALKNLNLHSFIVFNCLAAIFLFFDYRYRGRKVSLVLAVLTFLFACSIKHLGLVLFVNLWIAYLL